MNEHTSRRGFLVTCARAASLGGLAALVARLLGRSESNTKPGTLIATCRDCAALARCRLPEGARARDELGVETDAGELDANARGRCRVRLDAYPTSRWTRREVT